MIDGYTFASDNSRIYKYSTAFAQGGRVRVELYLYCGEKIRNEAIFDALYAQRELVDAAYGARLEWDKLEARRACRIAKYRDGDIDADSETLMEIRKWMIENLLRFKQVLPAFVEKAIAAADSATTTQT
jgi:hypothetical protein